MTCKCEVSVVLQKRTMPTFFMATGLDAAARWSKINPLRTVKVSVHSFMAISPVVVQMCHVGPNKLISQHHVWSCSVILPKLWNPCFPLRTHFGISLRAAPSGSQMSEVRHVISEVGRRPPLCSITWYLLRGPVNKHRCTTCLWGCSLNAIVPWRVQFLPPQRMNL